MIPLAVPNLCGDELKNLEECISSTFVSSVGEFVNKFEDLIQKETDSIDAVCVNTGTAAIHVSLKAVGVEKDNLVIIPSLTFIATANAVKYCGADPWIIDISEDDWNLSPELLSQELRENAYTRENELYHKETNQRIACILPVYTLGCPAKMKEINRVAKEFNLPVVVDAAAALGSKYENGDIGRLADLTTFSFNGNKTITCGGGGAVIGRDQDLLDRVRHLSNTARKGMDYLHDEVGFNYRMTNISAAIGCAQINNLNMFLDKKKYIYEYYNNAFSGFGNIERFPQPSNVVSANWFCGLKFKKISEDKYYKVIEELGKEGIMARPFWMPIHMQPCFRNNKRSSQNISNKVWREILILPCSTNITRNELKTVSTQVINVCKKLEVLL